MFKLLKFWYSHQSVAWQQNNESHCTELHYITS